MELDFDKEINALLRQAARSGEFVSTNEQNHLDADEISAFAENALPEKTRNVYIKHFADCDRCRTVLSNTILLNKEAEIETASSAVIAPIADVIAEKVPWYRKMFLMPNLAYTMGALVLVFGGMLGFIALQSLNQTGSSDVSQIQKEESRASGPNSSDDAASYNSNAASNSNAMTSNTAATNSASNAMTSASNSMMSNTNQALITPSAPTESLKQSAAKPTDDALSAAKNESGNAKEAELSEKSKAAEIARNEEVARSTTGSAPPPPPPPPAAKAAPPMPSITMQSKDNLPQPKPEDKKSDRALSRANNNNSRQIGGKTFNRVGGVWIDSTYNAYDGGSTNAALPSTKTIRRGSSEYQKLDRQVRIIAESLDGAVIIVWRDGAYRIQ